MKTLLLLFVLALPVQASTVLPCFNNDLDIIGDFDAVDPNRLVVGEYDAVKPN